MPIRVNGESISPVRNEETNEGSREELLARQARLRYVCDSQPGFRRQRCGRGFIYLQRSGARLRSRAHLERIERLAIPPAWRDVWICRFSNGHLQSTGRDARARKQYIYHERWREAAGREKFLHLGRFGRMLPRIRRRVVLDLRRQEWDARKLTALAVRLLDLTALRIGSREYTRDNESYGLTTLEPRHVLIDGPWVNLDFTGKSGRPQHVEIFDRKVAELLAELQRHSAPTLLGYPEADDFVALAPVTVNEYLQQMTGEHLTAKSFRTWKASLTVCSMLARGAAGEAGLSRSRLVKQALGAAASSLGNTRTVCRKYYVHPLLIDPARDAQVDEVLRRFRPSQVRHFSQEEQRLLHVLKAIEPDLEQS